jgi:hypothetical protein
VVVRTLLIERPNERLHISAGGTPGVTLMAGELISGPPDELGNALLMGAGWVINLAVAEWVIRKRPAPSVRTASAVVSQLR